MKRSYAYLLVAAGIVAAISGVAIAQQAATPAATAPAATAPAADAATPAAVTPAAAFDIKSVEAMPVGVERGKAIAAGLCAACHMADGNSAVPLQPKLAGQHPAYLEKQLMDFITVSPQAKKENPDERVRDNAIMKGQVALLSADPKQYANDVKSLAMWFASQKLVPETSKGVNPTLGMGIYRGGIPSKGVPACAGCHSPTGAGIPNKYPRVSGQFADYAEVQLKAFREDQRKNSPANQMQDIAKKLTDTEIKAVADYMAGVR
ncbi:MAG: cc4 [Burkholderiaceae bacterium]|nr:cc4 [Burkholderiaceae bacterium]